MTKPVKIIVTVLAILAGIAIIVVGGYRFWTRGDRIPLEKCRTQPTGRTL